MPNKSIIFSFVSMLESFLFLVLPGFFFLLIRLVRWKIASQTASNFRRIPIGEETDKSFGNFLHTLI